MNLTADNSFARKLAEHALPLRHTKTEVLQINVGKLCNLTCIHCHVNAGPKAKGNHDARDRGSAGRLAGEDRYSDR